MSPHWKGQKHLKMDPFSFLALVSSLSEEQQLLTSKAGVVKLFGRRTSFYS